MGGYTFRDIGKIDIETSALIKFEDYEKIWFDIHTKFYIYQFYWISVSYYSYNAINLHLGLKVIKNVYIAYGFETNIGEIANYYTGTHMVSIGLNLGLRAVQGVFSYVKD